MEGGSVAIPPVVERLNTRRVERIPVVDVIPGDLEPVVQVAAVPVPRHRLHISADPECLENRRSLLLEEELLVLVYTPRSILARDRQLANDRHDRLFATELNRRQAALGTGVLDVCCGDLRVRVNPVLPEVVNHILGLRDRLECLNVVVWIVDEVIGLPPDSRRLITREPEPTGIQLRQLDRLPFKRHNVTGRNIRGDALDPTEIPAIAILVVEGDVMPRKDRIPQGPDILQAKLSGTAPALRSERETGVRLAARQVVQDRDRITRVVNHLAFVRHHAPPAVV